MSATSSLAIGRLSVRCSVLRDHPSPERVGWQLEELARGALRDALIRVLAPLDQARSDEIIMIRRLEIEVDLDVSRSIAELAASWAARIALAFTEATRAESRSTMIARFADDAHLLGHFLVERARGTASSQWFLRRYAGLEPLSVAAALRTAFLEDADRGLRALATVSEGERDLVVGALGAREARRVIETLAGERPSDAELVHAAEAMAPIVERWKREGARAPSVWQAAFRWMCDAPEALTTSHRSASAHVAAATAAWHEAHASREPTGAPEREPIAAIEREPFDETSVLRVVPASLLARLGPLAAHVDAAPSSRAPIAERTPFGGLLLLLPHLASLAINATWSDPCDRAVARLSILARCAGPSRARAVLTDRLLGRLVGLPNDWTRHRTEEGRTEEGHTEEGRIEEWRVENEDALHRTFAPALAARHARIARGQRTVFAFDAARTGRPVLHAVSIAEPEGYWLDIQPLDDAQRRAIAAEKHVDSSIRATRRATRVLRHLRMHMRIDDAEGTPNAPNASLALALAAQHVLHGFARRLPGFSESSPRHLYDNFLAFPATVEESAGRRIARMGRPPLGALLVLTGALRGVLDVPWLEGPSLELRGEG